VVKSFFEVPPFLSKERGYFGTGGEDIRYNKREVIRQNKRLLKALRVIE